jgi:hypothetical protein
MTQIQEKQAYLCVGNYSVNAFLDNWNDECSTYGQSHSSNIQPTQEDYDEWLINRICEHYIGSPSKSQIVLR